MAPKRFEEWSDDVREKWYAWKKADMAYFQNKRYREDKSVREKQKAYREANRGRINAYQRNYYAKKRAKKKAEKDAKRRAFYRANPNARPATYAWFRRAYDLEVTQRGNGFTTYHYGPPVKSKMFDPCGTVDLDIQYYGSVRLQCPWLINGYTKHNPTRQDVIDALSHLPQS